MELHLSAEYVVFSTTVDWKTTMEDQNSANQSRRPAATGRREDLNLEDTARVLAAEALMLASRLAERRETPLPKAMAAEIGAAIEKAAAALADLERRLGEK